MVRETPSPDQHPGLLAIWGADQRLPGTLEHASPRLVEPKRELRILACRDPKGALGWGVSDPPLRRTGVLLAYARGGTGSRRHEERCHQQGRWRALTGMPRPAHRTLAVWVSSRHAERGSLFCDSLLGGEAQQVLGGPVFALAGWTRPADAAKEGRGT